jgi:raffinose/stachyose/melibiose transport system permease protein
VPRELEEASIIDGAGNIRIYRSVVLPLLQPMIVTVIILQTLWIWNDFLLPLLVLSRRHLRTIPLAIYSFFGTYSNQWDKALATLVMGMVPIVVFFLALQRYIIKGITAGSLKG